MIYFSEERSVGILKYVRLLIGVVLEYARLLVICFSVDRSYQILQFASLIICFPEDRITGGLG